MPVKVENRSDAQLALKAGQYVQAACEVLPVEHLRGFGKFVIVDFVDDTRITADQRHELPGLYIPKLGGVLPWAQIAIGVLVPHQNLFKRLVARITFRANLTQVVLSLVSQHYYLTLGRAKKRSQMEGAIRSYTEKYFKAWRESAHPLRNKIFKPIQPWLEKIGKRLQRKYEEEARKGK